MFPTINRLASFFFLVGILTSFIWLAVSQTTSATAEDIVTSADASSASTGAENISPELVRHYKKLGIRLIRGKHLQLFTDLPADYEIDRLPLAFDLAVPQWAEAFGISQKKWRSWKLTGCLMRDPERFRLAGLYPAKDLPDFRSGFSQDGKFWMYDQQSEYYRRHLLLHEGVHGFMTSFFPTDSPPWHAEGMAELLATHQWNEKGLKVAYFPQAKTEVPMLGRISIVHNQVKKGNILDLSDILSYGANAHSNNVPYGWCWAAAAFLDGHPRYQARFRSLNRSATGRKMNNAFVQTYKGSWEELQEEWFLFIRELEHGYNFERTAIKYQDGKPFSNTQAHTSLTVDRGWQSSGIFLQAGETYQIRATGNFFLKGDEPDEMWPCTPDGITLHYRKGFPLGLLQGCLKPKRKQNHSSGHRMLIEDLGSEKQWIPTASGTLYMRINSEASRLVGNSGEVKITISRITPNQKNSNDAANN